MSLALMGAQGSGKTSWLFTAALNRNVLMIRCCDDVPYLMRQPVEMASLASIQLVYPRSLDELLELLLDPELHGVETVMLDDLDRFLDAQELDKKLYQVASYLKQAQHSYGCEIVMTLPTHLNEFNVAWNTFKLFRLFDTIGIIENYVVDLKAPQVALETLDVSSLFD